MRKLLAFLAGVTFGIGLLSAGMANPAKVLAFLDLHDRALGLLFERDRLGGETKPFKTIDRLLDPMTEGRHVGDVVTALARNPIGQTLRHQLAQARRPA